MKKKNPTLLFHPVHTYVYVPCVLFFHFEKNSSTWCIRKYYLKFVQMVWANTLNTKGTFRCKTR